MLTTIHITVCDRVPTITAGEDVISHNSDYVAEFVFDEEWQDKVKTVYFVCEDGSNQPVVMSGNSCDVPMMAGEHRRIFVGVQAGSAEKPSVLKTTCPCCLKVRDSIADLLGQPIPDPTPSVYEQIITMLNNLTTPTWNAVQNKPFSTLGDGLSVDENGVLSAEGGTGGSPNAVQYVEQTLSDEQKAQARKNIGAGTSSFSGSYNDLTNKPTIPTQVTIDSTLMQSGQAADAKAVGDALQNFTPTETLDSEFRVIELTFNTKLDKNQGTTNAGKILGVGEDGNVIPQDKPTCTLPQATADALGGIKADAATAEDTQDVRIRTDGKLVTKPTGGSTVTVDSELSSTSVNPVQNKIITAALVGKITAPTTAAVGQIIKVKSVDTAGKPTEWEAADLDKDEYVVLVNTTFAENKLNTDMWLDETLYAATHVWRSATPLDLICMCIYVPAQTENIITSGELKVGVLSDDKDSNYWDLPPGAPYFGYSTFVNTTGQNRWRKFIFDLRTRTAEVEVGNNSTKNAVVGTSIACMPQFGKYYAQSAYLQAISIRLIAGSLPAGTELFVYGRKNNGNRIKHPGWSIT